MVKLKLKYILLNYLLYVNCVGKRYDIQKNELLPFTSIKKRKRKMGSSLRSKWRFCSSPSPLVRKTGRRSPPGSLPGVWSHSLELTEHRCDRRSPEGAGWQPAAVAEASAILGNTNRTEPGQHRQLLLQGMLHWKLFLSKHPRLITSNVGAWARTGVEDSSRDEYTLQHGARKGRTFQCQEKRGLYSSLHKQMALIQRMKRRTEARVNNLYTPDQRRAHFWLGKNALFCSEHILK